MALAIRADRQQWQKPTIPQREQKRLDARRRAVQPGNVDPVTTCYRTRAHERERGREQKRGYSAAIALEKLSPLVRSPPEGEGNKGCLSQSAKEGSSTGPFYSLSLILSYSFCTCQRPTPLPTLIIETLVLVNTQQLRELVQLRERQ